MYFVFSKFSILKIYVFIQQKLVHSVYYIMHMSEYYCVIVKNYEYLEY